MKSIWNVTIACAVIAAFGTAGCERRELDRTNDDLDEDRIEQRADETADEVRTGTNELGERTEQAGRDTRAELEEMQNGVTFEVARVDRGARMIELRKANMLPTIADREDLKEHEVLTLTFDDLAKHVEGDKAADEIAEDLRVGKNMTVFMNADKKITKITY